MALIDLNRANAEAVAKALDLAADRSIAPDIERRLAALEAGQSQTSGFSAGAAKTWATVVSVALAVASIASLIAWHK